MKALKPILNNSSTKSNHLNELQTLLQLIFLILFILTVTYFLPRKGFDFTDHGLSLYKSWLITKGIIPSTGFATLPNAIFMLFGFKSYLFFERLAFIFVIFVTAILGTSFIPLKKTYSLGLITVSAYFCFNSSIINYTFYPICYLILGFGLFIHALKNKTPSIKRLLFILSGIFLVLGCFSNIALLPTFISTWILLFFLIYKSKQSLYFHLSYLITGILLAIIYFHSPLSINNPNVKTSLGIFGILKNIIFLIKFLASQYLLFLIPVFYAVVARLIVFRLPKLKNRLQGLFIILLISIFLFYYSPTIILKAFPNLQSLNQIQLSLGVLFFYYSLASCILFFSINKTPFQFFIFFLLTSSYGFLLSITTAQNIPAHIAHVILGYIILFAIVIEKNITSSINRVLLSLFTISLTVITLIIYLSFSYRSAPIYMPKVKINHGILQGIFVTLPKLHSLRAVENFYRKNNCKHKYFLVYPGLPLYYYIFSRRAYLDNAWITAANKQTDPASELKQIENAPHWCIVYAVRYEEEKPILANVTQYAEKHHTKKRVAIFNKSKFGERIYPTKYIMYSK